MNTSINMTSIITGWNTYNTRSVLSHVLMPEGFAVNLSFKNYSSGQVLREALIGRFGQQEEKIHPGIRSYDGTYTQLRIHYFDTVTEVESTVINHELYLLVTPIKQELRPMTLLIQGALLWGREGYVQKREDILQASLPNRNVIVWTDGESTLERNTGLTSPYLSVQLDRPVVIGTGERITTQELRRQLDQAKAQVIREVEKYGELSEANML